jgi:proline iminopeptidase
MVPVRTRLGSFRVRVEKHGDNPDVKLLLLHGGPGLNHEYLEPLDDWLPGLGVEYYHYDQLGSYGSDQPDTPELWTIERFTDEVEQVRTALGLDSGDFVLFGHSWGGLLAIEYALAHPERLKGLIISSMMASSAAYNVYAREVLLARLEPAALAEIQALDEAGRTSDPRFDELLMEHYNTRYILRLPPAEWPECIGRSVSHINPQVYGLFQGTSELQITGALGHWDRTRELSTIMTPTLVIGGEHDTMDPKHLAWMAEQLPNGRHHNCPSGSHFCFVDDRDSYVAAMRTFLADLG